jgi:formylglycine-generating enzyme required for sulfatase activity
MKKLIIVILLAYSCCLGGFAQNITNITASQSGKKIVVNYTLNGKEGISAYEIKLYLSTDGGSTWQGPLTAVSGAVGKAQTAGTGKSITWDVLKEPGFTQLKGDNIQFKIKAFNNTIGDIEMVWVEGGSFMMGSNEGDEDEKPVHEVSLNGFYMGKYEVTQEQWVKVMASNPSNFYFSGCLQCPIENVSWNDVQDFIIKLNAKSGKSYRLPTEAEWEYAAKGGNKNSLYKYAGSDNIDEVAFYANNANNEPHPVGTKKANTLGIFDMTGNVWEWCSDWYDKNHYQYSAKNNPEGVLTGDYRVLRGGSFSYDAYDSRTANRNSIKPSISVISTGFRLACSVD